jgi:hypothetical protein
MGTGIHGAHREPIQPTRDSRVIVDETREDEG